MRHGSTDEINPFLHRKVLHPCSSASVGGSGSAGSSLVGLIWIKGGKLSKKYRQTKIFCHKVLPVNSPQSDITLCDITLFLFHTFQAIIILRCLLTHRQ